MKITKNFWTNFSRSFLYTLYIVGFLIMGLYWGYKEDWFGVEIDNYIREKIGTLQVIVDWFRNLCLILIGIHIGNILPIKIINFNNNKKNDETSTT